MSDLHDRFERLARRGSMRGGDAVLEAARRDADGIGVRSLDARATDAPTPVEVPVVEPVSLEPAPFRTRRRFGTAVAACGAAATLFVGSLAIGSLIGNGGGATSPEAAVRQLSDAVAHEDPLAAAAVLAPDEVRSLSHTVDLTERRAQELDLAKRANAPLAGFDASVDDLDLSTQSVGAGFAKVTVTNGRLALHTDTSKFSPLIQRALGRGEGSGSGSSSTTDLSALARGANLPTFVMTVEDHGHWYVSAAYTLLEYIRESRDLPAADFGSGVRAAATLGAATPDDAVKGALTALSRGDWSALLALSPPAEVPVYDYRAGLTQLFSRDDTGFNVTSATTDSTVDGDTAKVRLTAAGTDSSGNPWTLHGSCLDFPLPPEERADGVTSSTCSVVPSLIPTVAGAAGTGSSTPITAVQEDGRWFVSPVGTVLDLLDETVSGLQQRTVLTFLDLPQLSPPDGTLTLGTPVSLSPTVYGDYVYAYSGTAGEQLVYQAKTTPASYEVWDVRLFGPDGKEVEACCLTGGQPFDLPTTGRYLIAIEAYRPTTFTIWDAADAPESVKNGRHQVPTGECTSGIGGVETCTGTPSTVPPTTPTSVAGRSSTATSSTVPVQVP